MSRIVLDASVILAILYAEAGHETMTPELLGNATASSVNIAEVQAKLVAAGWDSTTAWDSSLGLLRDISPFTAEHARIAGDLVADTRSLGLSLGDRACLALGIALQAPIYTAERAWKQVNCHVAINLIR